MALQLQTGQVRLKWTETGGDVVLYLPSPQQNGITLDFVRKARTVDLITGAERTRLLGFVPVCIVKWAVYDPTSTGKASGITTGLTPDLPALLKILSNPTGLSFSPGLTTNYFALDSITMKPFGKLGSYYSVLEITFRGKNVLSTMEL